MHKSVYRLYIAQSKRTLKCIENGCEKLFCAFEPEQRTSYDPMHEAVVLIWGDPRPHTQPWCIHQLLRLRPPAIHVPTSDMFWDVGGSMAVEKSRV